MTAHTERVWGGGAYTLVEQQYIEELGADAYLLQHTKSGARVFYVAADDTNKVFSITFRTPPADNTGVAHILEHSVLCGSRKFPLKEPFVELVKGSLNTFLNAMTYPDKTMYPVASKNDKDFCNLMDVYCDAVFYPRVITDPDIVKQEGWHYELDDQEAPLTYKGVVYNEMKGVYSSPDSLLQEEVMTALFPDTTYAVDSGGNPDFITDLTFEDFVAFYTRYYHPSNSYIYLYGKMDIEDQLCFLDREYLSAFTATPVDSSIAYQAPFGEGVTRSFPYHIASEESEAGKCLHTFAYALPTPTPELALAMEVLTQALVGSPAAPLRERLLAAGIGNDVTGEFADGILQPMWQVTVTGSERDAGEKLQDIVETFLQEQVAEGLDKVALEAALNSIEFVLREAEFGGRPMGLAYNIRVMDQWLYDRSPFEALRYEAAVRTLREGLHTRYYEDLIETYFLENAHKALVTGYPEKGLDDRKQAAQAAALAARKEQMTAEEIDALVADTAALKAKQAAPDSEEALATIPLLALSDLDPHVEEFERETETVEGVTVHKVPTPTHGIVYTGMYFHLDGLRAEDLPYLYLIADTFGRLHTETQSYEDLDKDIHFYLGGLSAGLWAVPVRGQAGYFESLFRITVKALRPNTEHIWRLCQEVALGSRFADAKRVRELVEELKAVWDMEAFRKGHSLVTNRLLAQVDPSAAFSDAGGLAYYQFLADLLEAGDWETVAHTLQDLARRVFTKARLEVMLSAPADTLPALVKEAEGALAAWPVGETPTEKGIVGMPSFVNEGIISAGQVQYVAKGGNFRDHGFTFSGSMRILETILKYDYLWTKVRVQGGAYGAFATCRPDGGVVFCSYRDPNLLETYAVYDGMASYVENLTLTDREMRKYIIGTMSGLDVADTPALRGAHAMTRYFRNVTAADMEVVQREVIAATPEDIRALAPMVRAVMAENRMCAMGSEQKIKEAASCFATVSALPS